MKPAVSRSSRPSPIWLNERESLPISSFPETGIGTKNFRFRSDSMPSDNGPSGLNNRQTRRPPTVRQIASIETPIDARKKPSLRISKARNLSEVTATRTYLESSFPWIAVTWTRFAPIRRLEK